MINIIELANKINGNKQVNKVCNELKKNNSDIKSITEQIIELNKKVALYNETLMNTIDGNVISTTYTALENAQKTIINLSEKKNLLVDAIDARIKARQATVNQITEEEVTPVFREKYNELINQFTNQLRELCDDELEFKELAPNNHRFIIGKGADTRIGRALYEILSATGSTSKFFDAYSLIHSKQTKAV